MLKKEDAVKYGIPAVALTATIITFCVAMSSKGKKILKEALKFNGQVEIHPNKGWKNKYFERMMTRVGWKSGYDYCVIFTKLVLLKTLKGKKREAVEKMFSPSSQTTWVNLVKNQKAGLYKLSKKATPGSIAFYKHMKKKWRGHADIVIKGYEDKFSVVTANGKIGVETKDRKYSFNSNTFRLLGFVKF